MEKGYKGFDGELKCRDYQYEVGKEYTQEGDIQCCNNGFHFCENPFDVFEYYAPSASRYCEVEGTGETDRTGDKTAVSHIKIKDEIGLNGLINAGAKFILDKVNWKDNAATNTGEYSAATNTGYGSAATNTGDCSAATNTGEHSAATNTGYGSAAINTGDCSAATVEGRESIAIATGYNSKATGALGCWIVLAERKADGVILDVKAVKVDGEIIKPNTYYTLVNGNVVEVG